MLVRTETFRRAAAPGNTGFVLAGAGAGVGSGTTWTNPGNITAQDGVRAGCNRTSAGTSQNLYASTFDFSSVPAGATITGIQVRIRKDYSAITPPSAIQDLTVRLTKDGTNLVGDNKADTVTNWVNAADTDATYGSSSDLWGISLSAAEVKTSTFGVMLAANFSSAPTSTNARVDVIWIRVDYTA